MRKLISDIHGMELPIAIVVMLVVGVAALAALLAILGGAPGIPKQLNAEPMEKSILIWKGEYEYTLKFQVNAAGSPVKGAECVLRGLGATNLSSSDDKGIVSFSSKFALPSGVDEACLELICRKPGYREYSNDCAIKVIRG